MSGITITPDSGTQFEAGAAEYNSIDRLTDDSYVIAYRDNNDYNYGKVNVGSRTGTSVTINESDAVIFNNDDTDLITVRAMSATLIVISYRDISLGKLYVIVGTISGTTITLGSAVNVENTQVCQGNALAVLDGTYFVVSNSGYNSFVGSVSGTTITLGTAQAFPSSQTLSTYGSSVGLSSTTFAVVFRHPGFTPYYYSSLQMVVGTVDTANKTISYSSSLFFTGTAFDPPTKVIMAAFDEYHILVGLDRSVSQRVELGAYAISPITLSITGSLTIDTGVINYQNFSICAINSYSFLCSYYTATGTQGEIRSGTLTGDTTIAWDAQGAQIFDNGTSAYTSLCRLTDDYFILGYKSG